MERIKTRLAVLFRLGKVSWGNRLWALLLLCATTAIAASAQTFTSLHSFDKSDGSSPYAGLVQATDGDLYGTTFVGGTNNAGTVFRITRSGALTTVYSFCSQSNCSDGSYPYAGLVQGTDGKLYGTTTTTVFNITRSGILTTLYSFCSIFVCKDGRGPPSALIQATNGNFYGTYQYGGAYHAGAVFKITRSGTLTTLYSFNGTDGNNPIAGLIQGNDGNLYGTTNYGGANGYGTVFKITLSGTLTTLYSFCSQSNCGDGSFPFAGLVQGTDGNFYGTTSEGGTNNAGTVFRITPGGTLTMLHSFDSQYEGGSSVAALVQATDGNFYGTTYYGGTIYKGNGGTGTAFEITPSGTLTILHTFDGKDGANLNAGLVQATNGNFYGTTSEGGTNHDGTVFRLSMSLGPFVETQPTSGRVGAAVKILGTDLTGATSVTFNGTAAKFTVVSRSEIKTTIPEGATTGTVEVTTPKGTLKSNVVFRVTK